MIPRDSSGRSPLWLGYVVAVSGVLICAGARALLEPVLGSQVLLLPYVLAVLPSAWIGGVGPGLTATALSVIAAVGSFVRPVAATDWIDVDTHIALFAFEATFIVALTVGVRRSRDLAAAHSAAKDALLAAVSHDLRTPLNVISGWAAQLLQRPDDPDLVRRAATAVQRTVLTQQRLVEDLLDVSRAARGKLTIAREPVDLHALVDDAVHGVRAAADRKRLALDVCVDVAIGPVIGDPVRLLQVVGNLLDNAVKFTPPHGRVSLVVVADGDGVRIEISDTGAGIPKEELKRVFEPFHQAHGRHGSGGGLGLGLAIVRQLVELHGGSVDVESAGANAGSRFVVRLPAGSAQAA
jgi:signal transduction histidine kinase